MTDDWQKRITDDAIFRLRHLADKLESEDALVTYFTEHAQRFQTSMLPVIVTLKAEGPYGTIEYEIRELQRIKPARDSGNG